MPSTTMADVRRDFAERIKEIENHFDYIARLDERRATVTHREGENASSLDSELWNKTLKASCFLLMYNLVEFTVKNAIQAIFDDLEANSIEFDNCRHEVRKIVLVNLKKIGIDDAVVTSMSTLALDIISKTFNKKELFPGNVDDELIREIARNYGFRSPQGNGSQLKTVRATRNDLAHGSKSFDEVGRTYGMIQITDMITNIKRYMASMLNNVDDYITNKAYLIQARN